MYTRDRSKKTVHALASVSLALSVLVSALIVLGNNATEFTGPQLEHLTFYLILAAGAGGVAFAIAAILGHDSRVTTVLLTLAGLAFAANFIFASEVPPIDGAPHTYDPGHVRIAIELLLAIIVLAAFYVWSREAPLAIALGLIAAQSVTIAYTYSQLPESQKTRHSQSASSNEPAQTSPVIDALAELSSELNVIHIMFDSLQANMFSEILEERPEIRSELDGFVRYADHAGYSNWTTLSLAAIQANKRFFDVHDGKSNAVATIADWLRTDSIFSALLRQGMVVSAVQPSEAFCKDMAYTCATLPRLAKEINEFDEASREPQSSAPVLGDLILLRVLPTALKPYVYNNGRLLFSTSAMAKTPIEQDITLSVKFARILAQKMKVRTKTPVYRFFHFYPPHKPFILDEDCRAHPGLRNESWDTYKKQATCSLKLFAALLQAIKRTGVYDKTIIVLQADTGLGMLREPEKDSAVVSKVIPYSQARLTAYGRPTLAIKALSASGPLKVDDTPTSHFTTFRLIDEASKGRITLGSKSVPETTRQFVVSNIVRNDATRIAPFDLYEIRGLVADHASWIALGTFSAPGVHIDEPRQKLSVRLHATPASNIVPGQQISLKAETSGSAGELEFSFYRRLGPDDFVVIVPWSNTTEVTWTVEDHRRTPCMAKLLVSVRPAVRLRNDEKYVTDEIELPIAGCQK